MKTLVNLNNEILELQNEIKQLDLQIKSLQQKKNRRHLKLNDLQKLTINQIIIDFK